MIKETNSDKVIVIFDCCYSGLARVGGKGDSKGEEKAAKMRTVAVKNKFRQGAGKYILPACLGSQEAYSTRKREYSIFTYYLFKGLEGAEDSLDKEGNVTPYSLESYVSDSIMSLPVKERPKQRPIMDIRGSGDIILASYPKPPAEVVPKQEQYQADRLVLPGGFFKSPVRPIQGGLSVSHYLTGAGTILNYMGILMPAPPAPISLANFF
jgi:hypothetical protein